MTACPHRSYRPRGSTTRAIPSTCSRHRPPRARSLGRGVRRSSRRPSTIHTISRGSGRWPIPCSATASIRRPASRVPRACCRASGRSRATSCRWRTVGGWACSPGTATAAGILGWRTTPTRSATPSIRTRRTSSRRTTRSSGSTPSSTCAWPVARSPTSARCRRPTRRSNRRPHRARRTSSAIPTASCSCSTTPSRWSSTTATSRSSPTTGASGSPRCSIRTTWRSTSTAWSRPTWRRGDAGRAASPRSRNGSSRRKSPT